MKRKTARVDKEIDKSYKYLAKQKYFSNTNITHLGYRSFLRYTSVFETGNALKIAWDLKEEANSIYYTTPKKAYRLWLESLLIYMESVKNPSRTQQSMQEIITFADSITKYIQPRHIRARKIFITVKISLDYHQALLNMNIDLVNSTINRAYLEKTLVIPYSYLGTYIKESVNSIYYN